MTPSLSGPAYRVETPRLVLRCWEPSDAALLQAAIAESLAHLRPWMPWIEHEPLALQERIRLLRKFRSNFDLDEDYVYGIFDAQEQVVLGGTGLHRRVGLQAFEIGYWIHAGHLRQGLATEVVSALTQVAFFVDHVERVEIRCAPDNHRSAAIPQKLGYQHEATLRRRSLDVQGQWRNDMVWTLFRDEWPSGTVPLTEIKAYDVTGRLLYTTGA